ncbi:hypothetical protein [Magnetofaba australis]|uniref:Putative alpha-amylase/alpha-mannosidase n=1 Tax=Magnetofaba australis IT-1 TaxID=1434232 RepID=A0A1Y2K9J1_9PROT|nr:hypothetical protein [Magnetofaba australis]OSM07283.1 putative alpha-amylase/alpha-mannosidase [Magnetofaba australis IT-1]
MFNGKRFHALGLHMHQPPGNLKLLLEENPWEAKQILSCYARPPRYAEKYADVAAFQVGFSGVLLEQLLDPEVQKAAEEIVEIPEVLQQWRDAENIELLGMGYYHPLTPLIPKRDWAEQIQRGRDMITSVFGRAPKGFWPAEMAFTMEMIPALVKCGYEYVVVDGVHVRPTDDAPFDPYVPYWAEYDGARIMVVARDRDMSNAQESGLDAAWLANDFLHKNEQSPLPDGVRLLTTWSDGENGGWFRQMDEQAGFFGHFFSPCMEHCQTTEYPLRPVTLSAHLKAHPPTRSAHVETGAWNVGSSSGMDFSQWAGSETQQAGLTRLHALCDRYWRLQEATTTQSGPAADALQAARERLLLSETSCYLFWGDDWVPQLHDHLDAVEALLTQSEQGAKQASAPPQSKSAAPTPQTPAPAATPVESKATQKSAPEAQKSATAPAAASTPKPAAAEPPAAAAPKATASDKSTANTPATKKPAPRKTASKRPARKPAAKAAPTKPATAKPTVSTTTKAPTAPAPAEPPAAKTPAKPVAAKTAASTTPKATATPAESTSNAKAPATSDSAKTTAAGAPAKTTPNAPAKAPAKSKRAPARSTARKKKP